MKTHFERAMRHIFPALRAVSEKSDYCSKKRRLATEHWQGTRHRCLSTSPTHGRNDWRGKLRVHWKFWCSASRRGRDALHAASGDAWSKYCPTSSNDDAQTIALHKTNTDSTRCDAPKRQSILQTWRRISPPLFNGHMLCWSFRMVRQS